MKGEEKRKHQRKKTANLLSYVGIDEEGLKEQGMGRALNISQGGVLIETQVPIDSKYILLTAIGIEEELIKIKGEVVYCRETEPEIFRTGVRFIESDERISDVVSEIIRAYNQQDMSELNEALEGAEAARKLDDMEPFDDKRVLPYRKEKELSMYSSRTKERLNTLTLVSTVTLIFAIFLTYMLITKQRALKEELASIEASLDKQSSMLFEGIDEINTSLKRQEKTIQEFFSKRDASLREQLDGPTQEIHHLKENVPLIKSKDTTSYSKKETPLKAKKHYHEVLQGETLYRIGKLYGISVEALRRLNNLSPNQAIYPGQKLIVTPNN